jgi:hypothetical protein
MTMILVAQLALLAALFQLLTPVPADKATGQAPGVCVCVCVRARAIDQPIKTSGCM